MDVGVWGTPLTRIKKWSTVSLFADTMLLPDNKTVYWYLFLPAQLNCAHGKQLNNFVKLLTMSVLDTVILLYSSPFHFLRMCMPSLLAMSQIMPSRAQTSDILGPRTGRGVILKERE